MLFTENFNRLRKGTGDIGRFLFPKTDFIFYLGLLNNSDAVVDRLVGDMMTVENFVEEEGMRIVWRPRHCFIRITSGSSGRRN